MNVNRFNRMFWVHMEYICCLTWHLSLQWLHQYAQFWGYLISLVYASSVEKKMVEPHVDDNSNVEKTGKCWQLTFRMFWFLMNMLFLLELLFQWIHQYVQFRGFLISFVHASFVEQKLVFWSNMQVFGSTCGSYGLNQY